jgi:hypothetical protein
MRGGGLVPEWELWTAEIGEFAEAEGIDSGFWMVGREGKRVADKGRRSFLRQGQRQQHYNTKGTGCQG